MAREQIVYNGKNSTDVLIFSGADELEEDFISDEIVLTFKGGRKFTMHAGDIFHIDISSAAMGVIAKKDGSR